MPAVVQLADASKPHIVTPKYRMPIGLTPSASSSMLWMVPSESDMRRFMTGLQSIVRPPGRQPAPEEHTNWRR
jgi:hypothetical protein